MQIAPLAGRETEPAVVELLALAQIHRDVLDAAARAPSIAAEYAQAPTLQIYGFVDDEGLVVGIIGIQVVDESRATIRDLAVAPIVRGRGVGQALIDYLRNELSYDILEGNTLAPAAPFYRRCGFDVHAAGTMPDGAIRLRFAWRGQERTKFP